MHQQPRTSPFRQPRAVWAVAFACVVSFMGIGLVDPILKSLAGQLHATASQVELLFTSYLVITAVAMLVTGWVSSRIGAKRTLIIGLAIIVVFAALAGSSGSIGAIVAFRAGWGLGNALFIATSLAVIVASAAGGFAGAIVLYEAALGVGIALGPVVGGLLGSISWRGPFYGVRRPDGYRARRDPPPAAGHAGPRAQAAALRTDQGAAAPGARDDRRRRAALQLELLHPPRLLAVPHGHRQPDPAGSRVLRMGRARRGLLRLRRPARARPLRHGSDAVRELRADGGRPGRHRRLLDRPPSS